MDLCDLKKSLETFSNNLDFLKIIFEMMDLEKNIKINTGIYKHYNDYGEYTCHCLSHSNEQLDEKLDMIVITYDKNKIVLLENIIKAFDNMQKKITTKLLKIRCKPPPYYYKGIDYDSDTSVYTIIWDTEP